MNQPAMFLIVTALCIFSCNTKDDAKNVNCNIELISNLSGDVNTINKGEKEMYQIIDHYIVDNCEIDEKGIDELICNLLPDPTTTYSYGCLIYEKSDITNIEHLKKYPAGIEYSNYYDLVYEYSYVHSEGELRIKKVFYTNGINKGDYFTEKARDGIFIGYLTCE